MLNGQLLDITDFLQAHTQPLNDAAKKNRIGTKPPPRKLYTRIYQQIRSALNITASLGPYITEPYTESELALLLAGYLEEVITLDVSLKYAQAISQPPLIPAALELVKNNLTSDLLGHWVALGAAWNDCSSSVLQNGGAYHPVHSRMSNDEMLTLPAAGTPMGCCDHPDCSCEAYAGRKSLPAISPPLHQPVPPPEAPSSSSAHDLQVVLLDIFIIL